MPYYIREIEGSASLEIWRIDAREAVNAYHHPSWGSSPNRYVAREGETPWDRLRAETPWFANGNPFHQTRLDLGQHNPRIARPLTRTERRELWSPSLHLEPEVVAASQGQANALLQQLIRICQTVQPHPATLAAFGHDIRNLILLASMEVEAHCRGVLVANGAHRKVFKTSDYVLLADIMGLREYVVRFPAFPRLEPIRPFAGWGLGDHPTKDLPWYDAYNAVKHDRETQFERANLGHAFDAMAACAVMLHAQYGPNGLGYKSDLSAFFHFVERPNWPFSEYYMSLPKPVFTPTHESFVATPHPILSVVQDRVKR